MGRQDHSHKKSPLRALPKIKLPPHIPATPEELARRKALVEEARRLREEIGPIGISTTELIRQIRNC